MSVFNSFVLIFNKTQIKILLCIFFYSPPRPVITASTATSNLLSTIQLFSSKNSKLSNTTNASSKTNDAPNSTLPDNITHPSRPRLHHPSHHCPRIPITLDPTDNPEPMDQMAPCLLLLQMAANLMKRSMKINSSCMKMWIDRKMSIPEEVMMISHNSTFNMEIIGMSPRHWSMVM